MKSRILAVVAVAFAVGSESEASILSSSSEAVREPSPKTVDSWNATALQQGLNASLLDAAEATAPAGPLASRRATISGGFLVSDGASSSANYTPFSGTAALDGLFEIERNSDTNVSGSWDPRGPVIAGNHGRGGHRHDRDRWRDRGNPYATPEPSTSVLLLSGLVLLGAYASLRRRGAMNA